MRGATANRDQLHAARVSRGLTQEQLATLAGVDVKTVRKAEQGKRLDVGSLVRLALALDTNVHNVIQGAQSDNSQMVRRKVVEQWQRAWEAQDIAGLMAFYHDQCVMHLPGAPNIPFGGSFRGKEQIARANQSAWSTCRTEPLRPGEYSFVVSDDTVLMHGMMGLYLPNGEPVRLWCMQTFTFEGDLIAEHRVEYDTLRFSKLMQLPGGDLSH
jgi:transcriptional regulator with XRE-family HTH domain